MAVSCSIVVGQEDISNPQSVLASSGDSTMAIGAPGNGVVSLGDGGYAVLTFERPIKNGNGWDFAIFENSFSNTFLESGLVEVSSDGLNYFQFESTSFTQDTLQIDAFGTINPEMINNLAGKYRATFGITAERLKKHKKEIVIMHPGPMNRGVEIDGVIADSDQAIILDQVLNGVASRMAILYLLCGGKVNHGDG